MNKQHRIRVQYKSGNFYEFWVNSFESQGKSCTWEAVSEEVHPIVISANEIESVWKIAEREV